MASSEEAEEGEVVMTGAEAGVVVVEEEGGVEIEDH